ncbi:GT4 family glycosyltransferase PelF [Streptomyces sp. NPDC049837]|uniref:GT4 family glycosyltransferase PelF n=1 Tax=Streptomyces sp. NPDC049837 TaxID=3155277 RepID=UPI00343C2A6D
MVAEGSYPIQPGGVSVWCDQLIRGLPEHEFDVVALTGSGMEGVTCELPPNVAGLRRIGLWAPTRHPWRVPRTVRSCFITAYTDLLTAILGDDPGALPTFEHALRVLHRLARRGLLAELLRSEDSVDVFQAVWNHRPPGARQAFGQAPLTLADVLTATDLVEHFLRPLADAPLRVDVVHAVANGPCILVGLVAKWAYGTPLLLSEHGVYLRERILAMRSMGLTPPAKTFMIRFFVRLTELGYRAADIIAPVNQFNQRWELRNGARAEAIRTVYNGVDPAKFPAARQEPAVPTLAFVGRIDPLKDLETLIRAFALVRKEVPEAKLRLFGPVPPDNEAYAARCANLVAMLGLVQAVTFEGPISPVSHGYQAGHLVVLSSISEGLPYSVIEAMTTGRTTVSTDVGGVAEAVGETGLLVPPRDPQAFGAACVRLLRDHALRRRLAAAAHHRALELFTIDRFVETFRDLYRETARLRSTPSHVLHEFIDTPATRPLRESEAV